MRTRRDSRSGSPPGPQPGARPGHLAGAAVAALLLLALPACAGERGDSPGATTAPPPATASDLPTHQASPTPPAVATPAPVPPGPGTPRAPVTAESTLTGVVGAGVTDGCVVLDTDQGEYLLLGEAVRELRMGSTVTVRGTVRTDMATICQQGTPFEVTEVLP